MQTVNMRAWGLLCGLAALALVMAGSPAWAQGDNNPPEVLTSELALKTVLESDHLDVNFVIVDTDNIVEVKIDGVKQAITPGDTVQIAHSFDFTKDVTPVVVSATDEHGHTRTVTYMVYRPGVNPETVAAKPQGLQVFASYDARLEYDTNPENDISTPFAIHGIKPSGTVPDSKQKDTRINVLLNASVSENNWTVYGGGQRIHYTKKYDRSFDVQSLFLGGSYAMPRSDTSAFTIGYTFTDNNLGELNYDQTHTVSPAWRSVSKDANGTGTSVWGADVIYKQFRNGSGQDNHADLNLRWDFSRVSTDQLKHYDRSFQAGQSGEGVPDPATNSGDITQFSYVSADWDWHNRYDSGLLFDIGAGVQFRHYTSDKALANISPLGDKRVDIPGRFSAGVGWQFRPSLRLLASYQGIVNISTKSPYVRHIAGIGLNGTF
jgi:hypothetical protein